MAAQGRSPPAGGNLVTLTFNRASPHVPVTVRAAFFRICADSTLRAPDSSIVATYVAHKWRLGQRSCHEFHCSDPIYLRVTNQDGERERLGPFEFLRAAEGSLFTDGRCIGTHTPARAGVVQTDCWQEVTLLSVAAEAA
jgi:hypothetical protein